MRAARPEDADALGEVAAITFPLACPPSVTDEAKAAFIAANLTAEHFRRYLHDPARRVLVAEAAGHVVGYTLLVLPTGDGEPYDADVRAAVRARPAAELSKVYVLPGHHGGGIAATLVAETIAIARAAGAPSVWLGVNQHNARANRFYEKQGFELVGQRRFLVGTAWESDFVRELPLDG